MTTRWAFDLTALSQYLLARGEHKPVRQAVRQLQGAWTAKYELGDMFLALNTLTEVAQSNEEARMKYGRALMVDLVISYARTFHAQSNGKSAVEVRPLLDTDLQLKHDFVCDLRNRAIAHLDSNRSSGFESVWVEERVVVSNVGGPVMYSGVRIGTNFRQQALEFIDELLRSIVTIVDASIQKRTSNLHRLLLEAFNKDAKLSQKRSDFLFDPAKFFRSDAAAEQWWSGGLMAEIRNEKGDITIPK
ncbi:hypothetical protein HJB90_29975 [Rhizobium sp. NLR10a]|uniref:hypothetical protein n=1 Tax=unclassified Rhizobium TaxID=2613769 RepID=UPI001C82EF5F|nr:MULTISPECIES: hypothetical protein [unclassified Rhizobium]MBX5279150.1 hypothetical protein [Rhizobium sp. NLR13a]MBX5285200.1 hypothetical protein [Rhizobium sp. NLR10a]MBX5293073.1 hypothetical protein [Rhizobium sp. NLR15a]